MNSPSSFDCSREFLLDVYLLSNIYSHGLAKTTFTINALKAGGKEAFMHIPSGRLERYIAAGLIERVQRGLKRKNTRRAVYLYTPLGHALLLIDRL